MPVVGIITPVYNAEKFIKNTIDSVINQTFTSWELILVDDCSTDRSVEIIKEYQQQDDRIKLIKLETNQGAAVARNTALEATKARYVAFIDSDDVWDKEKLAKQLAFMEENSYAFTYTNFASVSEDGEVIKSRMDLPKSLDYTGLLKNTAIACSTVIIDRDVVGDFRMPLVRKGQDTATWLKLLRSGELTAYLLDEVLNYYRQVEGSISSNKFQALKRTWNTYRNLEGLPFFKALYYFCHYVYQAIKRRL